MLRQTGKAAVRFAARLLLPRKRGYKGRPAAEGGIPVRNPRLSPWPSGVATGSRRRDRHALTRVLDSSIEGLPQPLAQRFAREWAGRCGVRFGVMMAHGTDALRIGLAAALDHDGLEFGGEVIVPNFSFVASATAALDRRLGVVLVDVDPDTLLLSPEAVAKAVRPGHTRAILPVHLYGHPADMRALRSTAETHQLRLIEDAAQAHGAALKSGPVGSLGHAAAFSFQSSKTLSSGEGGLLVTDDPEVHERAVSMQNTGRGVSGARWEHVRLGWNCRPTEFQAALLLARLEGFDAIQSRKRENFAHLREVLEGVGCVRPLAEAADLERHGMYMFALRYNADTLGGISIDRFQELIEAEGVPLYRSFSRTLADQPFMRRLLDDQSEYVRLEPTPVADAAAQTTVYLPHELFLAGKSDMDDIAAAIMKIERWYGS